MGYTIFFIVLLALIIIVNIVYRSISTKKHSHVDYSHKEHEDALNYHNDPKYSSIDGNIYHNSNDYNNKN